MYDRGRRDFSFQGNAVTDVHVGPGAYNTDKPARTKIRTDGYAPFNSLSTRDNFLTPNDSTVAAPGPGQYDVTAEAYRHAAAIGGSSLANRSQRFQERREQAPGPADYTLPNEAIRVGKQPTTVGDKAAANSRIRFKRVDDAPSIPFPGQAYGYEENEHGLLVKQPAPDKDGTLGPAFYRLNEDPKATQKYRGCHWAKSRTGRMDFTANRLAGPGPGDYDVAADHSPQVVHMNVREGKQPNELHVPRYNELLERQAARHPVPGPGAYSVKGLFDAGRRDANSDVEKPPFGAQARRFNSAKEETPGPGAYSDTRTALTALHKGGGAHLKRSPFGCTAIRFQEDQGVRLMPGPGAYTASNGMVAAESMKKVFMTSAQKGAFGSTAVRLQPYVRKSDLDRPGPASYEVKERPTFQSKYTQPRSSMFASLTNRDFDPALLEKSELPHPAMYNVDEAFHSLRDRRAGYGPRNEAAAKRRSFNTSGDRFAKGGGGVGAKVDPDMPGPANYTVKDTLDSKGAAPSRDSRFKDGKEDTPAPNHYHLSPIVESSVLRSTHNTSLNNPLKSLQKQQQQQQQQNASYVIRA